MSRPAATASATSRRRSAGVGHVPCSRGQRLERGDRAPKLVAEHVEPLGLGHSRYRRGATRSTARRAAAASAGSSSPRNGSASSLVARPTDVAERDERVTPKPARVVPRHVQPVELLDERRAVDLEPVGERDGRHRVVRKWLPCTPLLHASVPRADVLADVAAVDAIVERVHHVVGDRSRRLRPVRETTRGVEHARLIERSRRAGVDAERAAPTAGIERRARFELDVGHERPEHDPRAVRSRDEHRVLADEADAWPARRRRGRRGGSRRRAPGTTRRASARARRAGRGGARSGRARHSAAAVPRRDGAPGRERSSRAPPRRPSALPRAASPGDTRPRAAPS